jgi:hypothetical protein
MDRTGVIITLVVAVIASTVGLAVFGAVGEDIDIANSWADDELGNRAEETYGDDYEIVSSAACWDYCTPTAVRPSNQQVALLIEADRSVGWVSSYELSRGVPGTDVEPAASSLVEADLLEKRDAGFMGTEYRYDRPDGIHEDGLTDAQLRKWIADQLYLTDAWLTFDEVASSVPAVEWRVRKALHDLHRLNKIQTGEESVFQVVPAGGTTVYADSAVDHSPPGPPGLAGLIEPLLFVILAVIVVGVVQRFRTSEVTE